MYGRCGISILILSFNVFLSGLKIQYNGTVGTNTPQFTAEVRVNSMFFFSYNPNVMVEKNDMWKHRMQRVNGHQTDLDSCLHEILLVFCHTEGYMQWMFFCDVDNTIINRAYMKFTYGNISITFHLPNKTWNNAEAVLISMRLDKYTENGIILQEMCNFWHEQYDTERKEKRKEDGLVGELDGGLSEGSINGSEKGSTEGSGEESGKGHSGGEIAAITVGVIAIIAFIAFIAFCCYKKRTSGELVNQDQSIPLQAVVEE